MGTHGFARQVSSPYLQLQTIVISYKACETRIHNEFAFKIPLILIFLNNIFCILCIENGNCSCQIFERKCLNVLRKCLIRHENAQLQGFAFLKLHWHRMETFLYNLEWERFGWFIREIGPPTHFLSRQRYEKPSKSNPLLVQIQY